MFDKIIMKLQLKYFQIHYSSLRRILQVSPLSMMAGQKGQSSFLDYTRPL